MPLDRVSDGSSGDPFPRFKGFMLGFDESGGFNLISVAGVAGVAKQALLKPNLVDQPV